MEWAFGDFLLSRDRAELVGPDGPVHLEKQAFNLLVFLVENAGRVVTKDDVIDAVWGGRVVSDSTVATAVKQARKAVGDSGTAQGTIRTVHGVGFRFVAPVAAVAPAPPTRPVFFSPAPGPAPDPAPPVGTDRASLAVLRFQFMGPEGGPTGPPIADALPAELIANLSKLGWLHIIARGSSFRFDPETARPEEVAEKLRVRYVMTGTVEAIGDMITISIELLSAADGALVWSERYATLLTEVHVARGHIVAATVTALEIHVPRFEAEHARRLSPAELDAWSHYHLGLRHIYRFNAADNDIAAGHFRAALDLDREFARAHAGLSFTFWQQAFMLFGDDRRSLLDRAAGAAGAALDIDPHDPFAAFNMGRARWLQGDLDAGFEWLDRALLVNPNFAQAHYTKGLNKVFVGDPAAAQANADKALSLSPLDPLLYAMYGAKAMAHVGTEDFTDARHLAEKAARQPGAHFYIAMIAAAACELDGDRRGAERWRDQVRAGRPDAGITMFFEAFPIRDRELDRRFRGALVRLGFA
ncbi:MAG: winged helix-turn-helix domain-containing protein [Rhodobacterales bacterium]|nr:winged helix-turn-helix domain-containing protein [Rhodobacterales bacterium]